MNKDSRTNGLPYRLGHRIRSDIKVAVRVTLQWSIVVAMDHGLQEETWAIYRMKDQSVCGARRGYD